MKKSITLLPQKLKNRIIISIAFVLLLLMIPFISIQKLNAPFEKFILRFNRPPAISEIPQETSGSSSLSATGKVQYPHDYTVILLGDSMTERLGNTDELRGYLSKYYPKKTFEVLNYGYGATNIESIKERLLQRTDHFRDYQAITNIDFDLIIIESFANNPLSHYELAKGLAIQNKELDDAIALIKESNPDAKIAFLATIAPNKDTYAKNTVELSAEKRREWVAERIAYFENHIKYAKDHNIPLINTYQASQDLFGNGKMIYIDYDDFIHPSPLGVIFISQKIAEGIYNLNLLPNKN